MGLCKCLCEAGEVRASARKVKQVGDTDLCPQRSGGHQWALGRESRDCICSLCGLNTCELNDEYLSCRLGFPGGASGKEPACQCRRHERCRFDPWVGKIPWRRAWQPSPVFLPGESHGQRILVGYSPWVAKSQIQLSMICFVF